MMPSLPLHHIEMVRWQSVRMPQSCNDTPKRTQETYLIIVAFVQCVERCASPTGTTENNTSSQQSVVGFFVRGLQFVNEKNTNGRISPGLCVCSFGSKCKCNVCNLLRINCVSLGTGTIINGRTKPAHTNKCVWRKENGRTGMESNYDLPRWWMDCAFARECTCLFVCLAWPSDLQTCAPIVFSSTRTITHLSGKQLNAIMSINA